MPSGNFADDLNRQEQIANEISLARYEMILMDYEIKFVFITKHISHSGAIFLSFRKEQILLKKRIAPAIVFSWCECL